MLTIYLLGGELKKRSFWRKQCLATDSTGTDKKPSLVFKN